jgi:hypothetical protein
MSKIDFRQLQKAFAQGRKHEGKSVYPVAV